RTKFIWHAGNIMHRFEIAAGANLATIILWPPEARHRAEKCVPAFHAVRGMYKHVVFFCSTLDPTLPLIEISLRDISLDNFHRHLVNVRIVQIDDMIWR